MTHLALDRLCRMRPRSFGVRIVVGPHEIIDKVPFLGEFEAGAIFLESRGAVRAKIIARQMLQLRIRPQMMLPIRLVHRVERPRHPSDAALDRGELQLWKALEHARSA